MKHFVLLISLVFSVNCFAQEPDPDLFQTWYLQSFFEDDGAPTTVVSEINPSITPTLTINSDYEFTGMAACNTFSGTFNVNDNEPFMISEFASTDLACADAVHTTFENSYFSYLQSINNYQIETYENGLRLYMSTAPFGSGVFTNNPLSTNVVDSIEIKIYPNPAGEKLHIRSQNLITKIEMYSLNGKKINTFLSTFETLDISDLASGLYILKIQTEVGMSSKKLVKK